VGSVVVVVEPCWQGLAAGGFVGVMVGEGPAVGEGAVEAFEFAVGLGPVGPGFLGCDAEFGAGVAPQMAAVGGAVVGQDAFDGGDAAVGLPGHGAA
jgi:hypothetical protein